MLEEFSASCTIPWESVLGLLLTLHHTLFPIDDFALPVINLSCDPAICRVPSSKHPTSEQSWGPKTKCNSKLSYCVTKAKTADFGEHTADF